MGLKYSNLLSFILVQGIVTSTNNPGRGDIKSSCIEADHDVHPAGNGNHWKPAAGLRARAEGFLGEA